jgi:leucyl aminopeptidase
MSTLIKKISKATAGDKVYIFQDIKDLPKGDFDKGQLEHIKKQLEKGKKTITINHYGSYSFLVKPDEKKTRSLTLESCRVAGNSMLSSINGNSIAEIQIIDAGKLPIETLCFAEGMLLGNYQFLKYRSTKGKEKNSLTKIQVLSTGIDKKEIEFLQTIGEAVYISRDLVNEPVSFLNAPQYAKEVTKMGKTAGFKVEVFNKSKIESLKMGGLLAVNQGSVDPPVFVVMEHKPKNAVNKQPYVFVGKGVVYDTGGISLKPNDGMMTMKCDMGGAAAVAGAMYAIAKAELPVWVVGLTPATDNRPDGNCVVPGDVITISDGTTVEVLNTDAEGRLILSDALVYAKKYNPKFVIDLATLTGAAARAIGRFGIVSMSNTTEEYEVLKQSGNNVHERLVDFPLWDEYADMLKSDIADLKNIGGIIAGANTAGKFLEHFTSYPWVHLDIAGPAFTESNDSYRGKGGTASGLRLLFDFIRTKAEL